MSRCAFAWFSAILILAALIVCAACSGKPDTPPEAGGNQPVTRDMAAAAPTPPSDQPVAAPAAVLPPVVYVSASGERLTAVFDNAARTVRVTLPGGREITLPQAVSGSGARYSDGKETFWEHHGDGTYSVGDKVVFEGKVLDTE